MAAQSSLVLNEDKALLPEKIWNALTNPSDVVQGEERRKARTLAALLSLFIPLAFITVFITPIVNLINGEGVTTPSAAPFAASMFALVAYFLSRSRYYKIGAYITIAVPLVAVGGLALITTTPTSDMALFFLTLSIILGSLLLDARGTLIFGVIASVIIVLARAPYTSQIDFPFPILMFMIISTGILSLVSQIREGYIVSLEEAQIKLQQQIEMVDQARARAERSDQVKSAFLASMSHELRTPLNAIINFTRYVAKGSLGPINEEQVETLNEVVDSAKHLLNLINDVLDMSKIEAGSLNLFIEDNVNLNAILHSVTSTGKILIGEKPIELVSDVPDDLPIIRGDRQRILQILLNIMSNAAKFTEKGSIKIHARQANQEVIFSITDTGPGIDEKDQAAVFEAFKQTNTGLRQQSGTGLGMPISRNLAEAHGGRLWLESEAGKGSTFYVAIPIKSEKLVPSLVA
jgi:signal transduction histidine kinase